jgi:hypothetical protein
VRVRNARQRLRDGPDDAVEVSVKQPCRLLLVARHEMPVAFIRIWIEACPMHVDSALALTPAAIIRLA